MASTIEERNKASLNRKQRLKLLLDSAEEIGATCEQTDSAEVLKKIENVVKTANTIMAEGKLEDRAEHTSEIVMDANILETSHKLVSRLYQSSSQFSDHMYIDALKKLGGGGEEINWEKFSGLVVGFAKQCRITPTMYGATESQLTERPVRARQSRSTTTVSQEERPQLVEKLRKEDKGAAQINDIHKQLVKLFKEHKVEGIPWYQLVIVPGNFMGTVQNAHYLSFLSRDNIIGLRKGSDNYPEVYLARSEHKEQTGEPNQVCFTLTYDVVDRMTQFYNVTEPLLKSN